MGKFQFKNGLSKNVIKKNDGVLSCMYVETSDGRLFCFSNKINNTISPCYEVLTESKSARRLNVNYNNGVAYPTEL